MLDSVPKKTDSIHRMIKNVQTFSLGEIRCKHRYNAWSPPRIYPPRRDRGFKCPGSRSGSQVAFIKASQGSDLKILQYAEFLSPSLVKEKANWFKFWLKKAAFQGELERSPNQPAEEKRQKDGTCGTPVSSMRASVECRSLRGEHTTQMAQWTTEHIRHWYFST